MLFFLVEKQERQKLGMECVSDIITPSPLLAIPHAPRQVHVVHPGDPWWRGRHHILICVSHDLLLKDKRVPECEWGACLRLCVCSLNCAPCSERPGCLVERDLCSRSRSRNCMGVGTLTTRACRRVEGGWLSSAELEVLYGVTFLQSKGPAARKAELGSSQGVLPIW